MYGAAKSGLDAFGRGLADSLHGTGVDVLLVRPGFVTRRMTAGMAPAPLATTPAAVGAAVAAAAPRGGTSPGGLLWVPSALAPLAAAFDAARPLWRWRSRRGRFPPMRAPAAEDDRGLRETLSRGLRESGCKVDAVPDGQAAIEYLRGYDYELAALDWRMPGSPASRRCSGCAGTPAPTRS